MRLKKNVLRLLSCVAVMAAMVMLLLTGCDGGGEAPSSPAESQLSPSEEFWTAPAL